MSYHGALGQTPFTRPALARPRSIAIPRTSIAIPRMSIAIPRLRSPAPLRGVGCYCGMGDSGDGLGSTLVVL